MSEELSGPVTMYAKLPDGVQCEQCILQVSQSGNGDNGGTIASQYHNTLSSPYWPNKRFQNYFNHL